MSVDLLHLWAQMGMFAKGIVVIMAIMSIYSLTIVFTKLVQLKRSERETRKFAPQFSRAIQEENLDQAISLAVSPSAFEQAYRSLRRGGTLVFVGLPADNKIELPIFETVLNGITVVGSIVGTRLDLREVFELHAAGLTRVITEVRSLETVNEAIEDVEAGRVPARVVFVP